MEKGKARTGKAGERTYSSRELIRRFLPYLRKYRLLLYLDLFFASLTTLCDIVLPMIMRRLTNSALGNAPALTAEAVIRMALLYVLLRLIDAGAFFYMQSQGHIMGVHIETDMRTDAFSHLQRLSDTYYANTKIGQIMGRITNDLFDVTEFAHHCPEEFFIAGIKLAASFVILCQSSLLLTVLVFACMPVMLVVCTKVNHWLRSAQKAQRFQIGELNAAIEDSLLGQRVVKAFTAEKTEAAKFDEGNQAFRRIKTRWYYAMATFGMTTRLFDGLMYTVVIVAGGLFLVNGRINAGDLVAYILYVSTLIATIRRIVEFAEQFQRGMTGIERFYEIMDAEVDILDKPEARELQVTEGAIDFEDVSFEYPDDHNRVLRHLNLHVRPGENLALVGPSGGGKTTICPDNPWMGDAKRTEAHKHLSSAAAQGHVYADFLVGCYYYYGYAPVKKDYDEARKIFERAAKKACTDAMVNLGIMYDQGLGVAANRHKVLEYTQRAAEGGNASAQYNMSVLIKTVNKRKSVEWLEKSAAQN